MNYMVDEEIITQFHGVLKEILQKELDAGNTIVETFKCDWPYPPLTTAIILDKPFITPIQLNIEGIVFHNTNDPHCWKAEYHDKINCLLLACKFGNRSNFKPL